MQYRIDYMKPEELNSTLHLIREVFDEFNYEDYEFEGVESFYSFIDKKYIKKQLTSGNMLMLVARTDSNKIIGVIGISAENHISLLFVHKNFHRKGIGTNLLKYATKVCNYNDENLEKITVNSSPYAIEFYHNYGFEDLSELQESDGIVFLPMVLYVKKEGIPDDVSKDLDDVYEILTEFYTEACDEEDRLRSSKRGNLEFITTTTYIDKYLNPGDRILEIGAGPGIYSNYYAEQGYKVDAVELLDVTATIDPEEGLVEKLDTFTVTFENIESVAIEEYSYYPPYIVSIDDDNNMTEYAKAKFETVEGYPNQLLITIKDDTVTEITEEGQYALVIPRKDLIFNNDVNLLTLDREFVFYYEVGTALAEIQAPTNVTAVAISDTEVELSWDAVEGAIYYGIYINGMWKGAVIETAGVIDGLYPNIEYCFTIISISEVDENNNIVGYSEHSEPACATTWSDGVDEFSTAFNIYPNPVNDVLHIENSGNINKVSIYTVTGVMVYDEECVDNNLVINVSELQSGVYIIKIITEDNEVIDRFIKK